MSVNAYLFAAYLAIWTILFIYLVFLNRKQKQVARELQDIAAKLPGGSKENRPKSGG